MFSGHSFERETFIVNPYKTGNFEFQDFFFHVSIIHYLKHS